MRRKRTNYDKMNLSKFSRQKNIGERTFSRTWFYRSIVDRPPNSAVLDRTTIWQETRRKGTYLHSLWLATMGNKPSYFLPGLIGFFARSKQTSDLRNHCTCTLYDSLVFYSMLIHLIPGFRSLSLNFYFYQPA